ncbi:hypothetical protein [Olivibacter domesticus]|uniref:Uncharacterized protein n=1 Tax=Olivibacter domesticus TaxID=407022 RepID=A0A1H7I6P2_OLID1|nr:hypothetical protein [Olivibacter domesticus]SEK58243.1 hypothetical protein SAMN05661044_00605 [Olivibacter domesticus]
MEKLLTLYNIKTVGFVDSSHVERKYAFTSKMLANNVFIEYFTIDEFEEINDDSEPPEHGSRLSVIMEHRNKYYEFLMFHDAIEVGIPIILLQTIIFLIKLIEETEPDQLVEYLADVATDPLIPHEIPEKKFRDAALKMLKLKLQTVQNLIQEDNAARN